MEPEQLLEDLKAVLDKIGVAFEVRDLDDEELSIKGGFCEVRKERRLIVDKRYPLNVKIKTILEFLRGEDLEGVYIPPKIRGLIEGDIH